MKKAKIMLMTIAILAVAGGALAFKANKGASIVLAACDNAPTNAVCTINPIVVVHATTVQGLVNTTLAPFNSPCVNVGGQFTCTARTVFNL